MEAQATEQILSSSELAEYLGIPVATIYSWRSRGGGPPGAKVGRHTKYRRSRVDAWLEAREKAGAPA